MSEISDPAHRLPSFLQHIDPKHRPSDEAQTRIQPKGWSIFWIQVEKRNISFLLDPMKHKGHHLL
jgi:hypothetical protein